MTPPALLAISLDGRGDGVAVVASLLRRALDRHYGAGGPVVTMFDGPAAMPTLVDKGRFTLRMLRLLYRVRPTGLLFGHLGLVRALKMMPLAPRLPYALFLHGIEAWRTLPPSDRALVAGAAVRLANSTYTAGRFEEANPGCGPAVPCPLPLPETVPGFLPGASPIMAGVHQHLVLVVGRMNAAEAYKGHDQLIDAWPLVADAVPTAQLVIVGKGDDVPRLKAKAGTTRGGDRIVFAGFVTHQALDALYRRATVFAMPSRGEGFGLVYLEAMARGVPCIASREDAAQEVIRHGETGLLVSQADRQGLAHAIVTLLGDRDLHDRMSRASKALVASEHSFDRFADRVAAALRPAFGD